MATQSILELSRERYLQESEERLLQLSDAYFYKKKFLLGEGVDRDELRFTMQSHKMLCTEDCEMINFIKNKIAGKLESCGYTPISYSFENLVSDYSQVFNCSEQQVINEVCGWTDVMW